MRVAPVAQWVVVLVCATTGLANATATASDTYAAAMTGRDLRADTGLADPDWSRGELVDGSRPFADLTTRSAAPLHTAAYVLYDAHNVYVAFKAQQAGIAITANQTTNNVGFGLDDFVGVGIDTSGNGSTVYYFETTPRGTRYQQASENARYDPAWVAAGRIEGGAWTALMTIPLQALHRGGATQTWRINFVRGVAATGEHYTWAFDGAMQDAAIPQWPAFGDAQFWPSISGIRGGPSPARFRDKARADAYVLGAAGPDRNQFAQSNGTFQPEKVRTVGADLSFALSDSVRFVATLNPDFSNVEVDQQSIAPQEFKRPLVEYRPFFAQGASFLNPISPSAGAGQPNNQIFYSPAIGPFDRGAKIEGTAGNQSFGVLSFRGYDETTANEFDDVAYGYTHALPNQSFSYWSDGVLANHSVAGRDVAAEAGADFLDRRSGLSGGADQAIETGSRLPETGRAGAFSLWSDLHKPNYDAFIDYQDVTPNYNPVDGFTSISDTTGFVYALTLSGSSRAFKNYALALSGDRFLDGSGAVHQSDAIVSFKATLKDQISLTAGPRNGDLRSYATEAPGALGCSDSALPRSSFTGFPNYYCGRTDTFDQFAIAIGYRDGTQAPTDFRYAEGPFGGVFLQQYSLSGSRPLGTRFSIAAQIAQTTGRPNSSGPATSQSLGLLSLGENLGPNSNVALEVRSVSGSAVSGLDTVPGTNIALSYHSKFANGNELYVAYGTPAATQTLKRFIVKYVLRTGIQD